MNYLDRIRILWLGRLIGMLAALAVAIQAMAQPDPLPRRPVFGASFNAEVERGIEMLSVTPGTSAALADLQPGDTILEIGGEPVSATAELIAAMRQAGPGGQLELLVLRNGEELPVAVALRGAPAEETDDYTTIVSSAETNGNRVRVTITRPNTPGPHPVVFLVQGIGFNIMDFPLQSNGTFAQFLRPFAENGFVTSGPTSRASATARAAIPPRTALTKNSTPSARRWPLR
jgi:S1-C subfamily serine protease